MTFAHAMTNQFVLLTRKGHSFPSIAFLILGRPVKDSVERKRKSGEEKSKEEGKKRRGGAVRMNEARKVMNGDKRKTENEEREQGRKKEKEEDEQNGSRSGQGRGGSQWRGRREKRIEQRERQKQREKTKKKYNSICCAVFAPFSLNRCRQEKKGRERGKRKEGCKEEG